MAKTVSKKTEFFKQCRLEKPSGEVMVTWLPVKYCEEGRVLKLKKVGTQNEWVNGWVVEEVYNGRKPLLDTVLASRDYRSWREVTDV